MVSAEEDTALDGKAVGVKAVCTGEGLGCSIMCCCGSEMGIGVTSRPEEEVG